MARSLDIVFICHKLPYPPHKGFQVKPFHMMKGLARHGHRVHLVCPATASTADIEVARVEMQKICATVTIVPLSPWESRINAGLALINPFGASLSVKYFATHALSKAVASVVAAHPIAGFMLYSSTTAQYVPAQFRKRCLIDMGDVDSAKWSELSTKTGFPMSWVYRVEGKRLYKYEHWVVENFGLTNLATPAECELLKELSPAAKKNQLFSTPNGTDTTKFTPGDFATLDKPHIPEGEARFFAGDCVPIVFTGAMDYDPNVEAVAFFTKDVMPLLRARIPNVRFLIVGGHPKPEVKALDNGTDVLVTGYVKDAPPYMRYARVVVVPLRLARGIQNKAIEAMACGSPLVCTSLAAKGVAGLHNVNMLVGDSAQEIADHVIAIVEQPALAARLVRDARETVLKQYEWTPIIDELVTRLEGLIEMSA